LRGMPSSVSHVSVVGDTPQPRSLQEIDSICVPLRGTII
jgi:hypothetical protein